MQTYFALCFHALNCYFHLNSEQFFIKKQTFMVATQRTASLKIHALTHKLYELQLLENSFRASDQKTWSRSQNN